MTAPRLPASTKLITTPDELRALARRLGAERRIAFDTEAASFHRYVDRVYLVQVSSDAETALVDPLSVPDLGPLGTLLADPAIEIVFHDADYDLRILDRDYGFRARTLFDTMVAAQLAGEHAVGLGSLLGKYFGLKVDKKLQRADWSRRPLTDEMIAYAADDTRYLPALRDELEHQLIERQRLAWAQEEFHRLEEIRWTQTLPESAHAYLRIKGAKALNARQRAVLRALHAWREDTARALDRAAFRVLANATLITIARQAPTTMAQLRAASGVHKTVAKRYGGTILKAVRAGLAVPERELPVVRRTRRPKPDPGYERRLERLKLLRNRRAEALGMAPGLLCPNGTLQAVARSTADSAPRLGAIAELRKWQREVLGDQDLIAALKGD